MVRVAGISHLRVIRHVGNFKSELYDLSIFVKDLKKSEEMEDKELANFFDWFFEIGYSEIVLLIEQFSMKEIRKDCIFGKS